MYILLLNRANYVLGYHLLAIGGTSCVLVDIKILLQLLIKTNANGFLLCHNHPSNLLTPSKEDLAITSRIKDASKLFDVQLLDHLIITADNGYYSFADEGII